jgi:hypothetical protein
MLAGIEEKPAPMILEAEFEPVDLTTAVFRLTGRMTLGTRLRDVESKISQVANQASTSSSSTSPESSISTVPASAPS